MKIVLKNNIFIENTDSWLLNYLKQKLTLANPAYVSALNRWYSTWWKQKELYYYFQLKDANKKETNNIIVPRGMIWDILVYCKTNNLQYVLEDRRAPFEISENKNYPFANIKLKPNQLIPIENLKKIQQGVWVSPAGSWKTVMALKIIEERNSTGLILVHTNSLLEQFKERITSFLWIDKSEIWTIAEWKKNIKKPITVGLIQTVQSLDEKEIREITGLFGTVVIDECFVYDTKITLKDWKFETIWKLFDLYKDKDQSEYPEVLTLNEETKQFEYKKIKRVIRNRKRAYPWKMNIWENYLECTWNHLFFTQRGWIPAHSLQMWKDFCLDSNKKPQRVWLSWQALKAKWNLIEYYYDLEIEDNHNFFANNILVHNCHHVPATTFKKFAENVTSKYFYGLTATKKRWDGLEVLLDFYIWNTVFEIYKEDLQNENILLKPHLVPVYTNFTSKKQADYNKLTEELVYSKERNDLIMNNVIDEFKKWNHCLVLSKRVEHINILAKLFEEQYPFEPYAIITWWSTKESKHERLIREIKEKTKNNEKIIVTFKTKNSLDKFKWNMQLLDKSFDVGLVVKKKEIDSEHLISEIYKGFSSNKNIIFLYDSNKHIDELKNLKELEWIQFLSEDEKLECEDVTQIAINNKEIKMIFATMQKVWEGYDVPHLNRMFLTTPVSDLKNIEQYVWRVARTAPWKENAIVYDFVDQDAWPKSWVLWYSFKKRFFWYYKDYTIYPVIKF